MDVSAYVASLREDLTAAAAAGDEQTRRAAAMLSAALEPSARLAIMNALSDLAAEVTASLEDHIVDVRLDGRDVRVVVTRSDTEAHEPRADEFPEDTEPPVTPPIDGGDISRITLRLFDELKGKAEEAAAAQGMSLNSYVTQAVQGALHGKEQLRWMHERGHGQHGRGRGRARGRRDGDRGGPWGDWPGGGSRLHGYVRG
ncbi:HicB-like protein involved in pilus formation [Tamaricihabitans halophyticus]|uniref:HicB-like protein involved in pilus formation n=1 Tax=Tamaricihabitans halophyticus TaxID=1262583 RepID=A0A4R2QMN8_9PSEU|nr:toxin-antitoxin system HicB family antitoxin [Tamaricihabitans halophyticus]TCP50159.1 HicB-like protein involved in pilus formation [Tamaricihabitans halophyticus]